MAFELLREDWGRVVLETRWMERRERRKEVRIEWDDGRYGGGMVVETEGRIFSFMGNVSLRGLRVCGESPMRLYG